MKASRLASTPRETEKVAATATSKAESRDRAQGALEYLKENHVIVDHDGTVPSTDRQLGLITVAMDMGATLKVDGPDGNVVGLKTGWA